MMRLMYLENPKISIRIARLNEFSKVAGLMVNMQKSVVAIPFLVWLSELRPDSFFHRGQFYTWDDVHKNRVPKGAGK